MLDKLDEDILIKLSENCRQSNQEIAKGLGVTYHTIQNHIRDLEQRGILQIHRITLDLSALGRKYYKAAFVLNNPTKEEERKLYTFCSQFNFVCYLVEALGEWQFEVETEVQNEEEFMDLLRKIRNEFSELILDYHIFQVTKEHYLNYFPLQKERVLTIQTK